jgi:hypothetical protein
MASLGSTYGYTDPTLQPYHDAVRAGNPNAIVCMNNGVIHPIGKKGHGRGLQRHAAIPTATLPWRAPAGNNRVSVWQDYTCGESNDFTDTPTSRFVQNLQPETTNIAQWHTLGFLVRFEPPSLSLSLSLALALSLARSLALSLSSPPHPPSKKGLWGVGDSFFFFC